MDRQNSTTSVLTATTLKYAYRAGITAAAGTRLALCWLLDKPFTLFSFQLESPLGPLLLFLVTTSRCPDWVICAPAAFLGCGSRLSGSLSGIPHPRSVTRHNHGKTIPYHPKLIGQKFERCVVPTARSEKKSWITKHWFVPPIYTTMQKAPPCRTY